MRIRRRRDANTEWRNFFKVLRSQDPDKLCAELEELVGPKVERQTGICWEPMGPVHYSEYYSESGGFFYVTLSGSAEVEIEDAKKEN